jgi:chorismate dehydratase
MSAGLDIAEPPDARRSDPAARPEAAASRRAEPRPSHRLACVSYLNAKPLLAGLDDDPAIELFLDVPARLRGRLDRGEADAALLPVFDLFDARDTGPVLLPAGGIGCDGPTLTVRLFSRVPLERIRCVALDSDSRTSVALLKVLLSWRGVEPAYVRWSMPRHAGSGGARPVWPTPDEADALLLIGDKVVTSRPEARAFPREVDLGEAWRDATGLPFVFAAWTARPDADHAALHDRLSRARRRGESIAHDIADRHAPAHGWPTPLARRYLGEILRYNIGPREIEAVERFGRACRELGLTRWPGPLHIAGAKPT